MTPKQARFFLMHQVALWNGMDKVVTALEHFEQHGLLKSHTVETFDRLEELWIDLKDRATEWAKANSSIRKLLTKTERHFRYRKEFFYRRKK